MSIIQTFYDNLSGHYDKLFLDWQATVEEQALFLDGLFKAEGFDRSASVLDCACGIGTQAIGLAALGYDITASDFSTGALEQARIRAAERKLSFPLIRADFRALSESFDRHFDILIAMDNALPHMLSAADLERALGSIVSRLSEGGIFVASIRDYDALLESRPPYSPPYIHETGTGKRVSFQTWKWEGENYRLTQYIIDDGDSLEVSKFECEYRAARREEITKLLREKGCRDVRWLMPEECGFYQPVVIARK